MNFAMNIFAAAALFSVVAMANGGNARAEDPSGGPTMKPLYAVSFDVGTKHVLSYFLKKERVDSQDRSKKSRFLCDLTVMVMQRPAKDPEGLRIPPLSTTKFKAEIDGGGTRMVGFDTLAGRMLEYGCAPGAQAMSVRQVYQAAKMHPPLYSYEFENFHEVGKVSAAGVGG